MALSLTEKEVTTRDYLKADGGKAWDIFFSDSFLLNYFIKSKKGIYTLMDGGEYAKVPLMYDGAEAGFYLEGDNLSSDDRPIVNAARFQIKHAYSNATITRIVELANSGAQQDIDLLVQKVEAGQKQLSKTLAGSLYDAPGGSAARLTGLRALCNETTTTAYGNIQEADLVSDDGTTPWEGKMYATAETIKLDTYRDLKRKAKVSDGPKGKPNFCVTTETLWNTTESILSVQQRFVKEGAETAKAGFSGIYVAGMEVFPDDYCPASHIFALNENYIGFAIWRQGNFYRMPWAIIEGTAGDQTTKFLFDGNLICSNRKAHQGYSNVS